MTHRSIVAPQMADVNDIQFRAAMLAGIGRAESIHGARDVRYVMDLETKQFDNIKRKGATPHPKRLWDILALEPTALDDIARLYGKRLVSSEAGFDVDDAGIALTKLLLWFREGEKGGLNHNHLLQGEFLIRQLHQVTGDWIEEISRLRQGAVA